MMDCVGIFGTAASAILVLRIPVLHKPCPIQEEHRFSCFIFCLALNLLFRSVSPFCTFFINVSADVSLSHENKK
jgi:hypothetical protein